MYKFGHGKKYGWEFVCELRPTKEWHENYFSTTIATNSYCDHTPEYNTYCNLRLPILDKTFTFELTMYSMFHVDNPDNPRNKGRRNLQEHLIRAERYLRKLCEEIDRKTCPRSSIG